MSAFEVYKPLVCAECREVFKWRGTSGRWPDFCGQVCKQRAYRRRKAGASVTSAAERVEGVTSRMAVHSIGLRPGGGRRTVWSSLAWAARPAAPCESFRFGGAA